MLFWESFLLGFFLADSKNLPYFLFIKPNAASNNLFFNF